MVSTRHITQTCLKQLLTKNPVSQKKIKVDKSSDSNQTTLINSASLFTKMITKTMNFISVLGFFQDGQVIVWEIGCLFRKTSITECNLYFKWSRECTAQGYICWCVSLWPVESLDSFTKIPVLRPFFNIFQLIKKYTVYLLTVTVQGSIFIPGGISCSATCLSKGRSIHNKSVINPNWGRAKV